MPRVRVYADTSVFGGARDAEFMAATRRFFAAVARGEFTLLLSRAVVAELAQAPVAVQRTLEVLPAANVEEVPLSDETERLAQAYIDAGVLGEASREDALHVAAATVAGADLIVSWNFRHIVNYERIRKFNAVNLLKGYRPLDIRSPLEVAYGDEDESI
jgi:predicted nucleic acid-binding protein